MSYKALLFCPDDKTARIVTQILSELDFHVEPCNEPFAAVKKLMAEHFDAIVVDCENEQNATLLFKSARNSGSNQTSLSVAVVEGQSGVAKAFRIGANLVLTKPINMEQSKGTLRVARGLLRKSDATKSAASAAGDQSQPPASTQAASHSTGSQPPSHKPSFIAFPALKTPPPAPAIPVASASLFEVEEDPAPKPEPAEAALLESLPDPLEGKPGVSPAKFETSAKAFPWKGVLTPPAESKPSAHLASPASGVGAAAAPAREEPKVKAEPASVEPPNFSSLSSSTHEVTSSGGGRKKILIAAVAAFVVGALMYVGWAKMHSTSEVPSAQVHAAPLQSQAAAAVPAPSLTQPAASEANGATTPQGPDITLSTTEPVPSVSKKSPSIPATAKPAKALPEVKSEEDNADVTATAAPIVVRGDSSKHTRQNSASEEMAQADAPAFLGVASNSGDSAIAGIVSAPAGLAHPAPQALRISQGVSQGLLVKKVQPVYPQQAMTARTQGTVQLLATISKAGNISNVKLISGDPLLAHAAMDAVKQWKYKPYYLDSQAVEIQTQITINFKLP